MLWTEALAILNGPDREWQQMLPRDLDDEQFHGRRHIDSILSMTARSEGHAVSVRLARPFLSVLTHPVMLDCLSVDTSVGALYNFTSGTNGSRAIPFFRRLCTHLDATFQESGVTRASVEEMLVMAYTALREILKREQRAAFHEDLPDLLCRMQDLTDVVGIDDQSAALPVIIDQRTNLQAVIARANGRLVDTDTRDANNDVTTTTLQSTYPREIIVPGGHHDNDHRDITKIDILPTENEIRCDHPEFLPSTDTQQLHFLTDPVARHLDTHFRLLRHDIFGELKEVLGRYIHRVTDDPTVLEIAEVDLGNVRAYSYTKARVGFVSFRRNRGIEAHVSFDQLRSLRQRSASERRKWWDESRRLDEGSLCCFVSMTDAHLSLLFLTVSKRCTDPKESHSLSSHSHSSTIVTNLATRNQRDLETLIRLSCQSGQGILIEFPGILLATFVPILVNLQTMHRFGRLPFRRWIVPANHAASMETLDVHLPLYARGAGFTFALDSIMRVKGDQLAFDPRTLPNDTDRVDELEARTTLDHGQCVALVAALTREFAFIQGPPGTGKSYLGVQLLRVLLACKDQANLGPVAVV